MTQEQKYPYQFVNTFIVTISFRRVPKLPPTMELATNVGIQVVEPGFPRVQVGLKVSSPEDSLVSFNLEVVGLFDYTGQRKEYDKRLNREFAQEKALPMLWLYSSQIVKMISSQLGMAPLELRSPNLFTVIDAADAVNKKERSSQKREKKKST